MKKSSISQVCFDGEARLLDLKTTQPVTKEVEDQHDQKGGNQLLVVQRKSV